MTEIVTVLCCRHRLQYVERKYFGFVALIFVVVLHALAWRDLEINGQIGNKFRLPRLSRASIPAFKQP
jgi:hypothetical protein